ncbi:MAG TPA: hypothetical protein VGI11_17005 [Variovorax sp.]
MTLRDVSILRSAWLRSLSALPALAAAMTLAGCATDPTRLPLGSARAEALKELGKPTATYPMPNGGERLQYSREPSGFQVDNVDLDAAGRVIDIREELTAPDVNSPIVAGQWREADVLRTYGRPYRVGRVFSFDGVIWSWQFMDHNEPRLFHVFFDPDGVVDHYFAGDNPNDDMNVR